MNSNPPAHFVAMKMQQGTNGDALNRSTNLVHFDTVTRRDIFCVYVREEKKDCILVVCLLA